MDFKADLALIYLEADLPKLKAAPEAKIGDWAIIIGNPLDLTNAAWKCAVESSLMWSVLLPVVPTLKM